MKVKVLKTFKDRETKSILRPGLIIDIAEERVEELTSTLAFIAVVEEPKGEPNKDPEQGEGEPYGEINVDDGKLKLPDFEKMKKENIIKFAKDVMEIELNMEMNKTEMIELLKK